MIRNEVRKRCKMRTERKRDGASERETNPCTGERGQPY